MTRSISKLCRQKGRRTWNHSREIQSYSTFDKDILEDAKVNLYVNAVIRRYCEDEDLSPIPVRPPFLSEGLISCIKYVKENVKQFDSKTIYRALLLKEFDLNDAIILKVEEKNRNFKENALRITN